MTNEELMNIFGFISTDIRYNQYTFAPRVRLIRKDLSYEDTYEFTSSFSKERVINEYLSNKLYIMYEKRNSKIDEILNNLK